MITIGVFGSFQNGKSTLINCLLGCRSARTGGEGVSVTSINSYYAYGKNRKAFLIQEQGEKSLDLCDFVEIKRFDSDIKEARVELPIKFLREIRILDTPGFNANSIDTISAEHALSTIDVAIVLLNNKGISNEENQIITKLERQGVPYLLLMNCLMQQGPSSWNPQSDFNKNINRELVARIENCSFHPITMNGEVVFAVNLMWYWYGKGHWKYDTRYQKSIIERNIRYYEAEEGPIQYEKASNFKNLSDFVSNKQFILAINLNKRLRTNFGQSYKRLMSLPDSMDKNICSFVGKTIKALKKEKILLEQDIKEIDRIQLRKPSASILSYISSLMSLVKFASKRSQLEKLKIRLDIISNDIKFYDRVNHSL